MKTALIRMPETAAMHRQGHVLLLSGHWHRDLLDELSVALNDLKLALPRHPGAKRATLHLFNFSMELDATSGALSLIRRTFLSDPTRLSLVAEGFLHGSAVVLLVAAGHTRAGTQRKVYSSCAIEFSLHNSRWARYRSMGIPGQPAANTPLAEMCRETSLLSDGVIKALMAGDTWSPKPAQLLSDGLVDKVIVA